jgi:transketolase
MALYRWQGPCKFVNYGFLEVSMSTNIAELERVAREIRGGLVEISHRNRVSHLGSSLSCVDILVALYWSGLHINPRHPDDPERDRFILSKGHAASALFKVLASKGFFPETLLTTYGCVDSPLEEHPGPGCVPGVEAATGSLGHGLSIGAGMALGARLLNRSHRVFVLMSDGECNEGSVWEAALFTAAQRLDKLVTMVDFNRWQATARSCETMALEPLVEKWRAFGWSALEIDGHNMIALVDVFSTLADGNDKPLAIIAHTIKGRGVSFMEDDNNWHYRIPTEKEVHLAKTELGLL